MLNGLIVVGANADASGEKATDDVRKKDDTFMFSQEYCSVYARHFLFVKIVVLPCVVDQINEQYMQDKYYILYYVRS